MEIIPFRIKASEQEDDFSDIYEFLIKGSNKDAYVIEIFIDDANDLGIVLEQCTCPHFKFRQEICKHITECKEILTDFDIIKTESINKTSSFKHVENPNPISKEELDEMAKEEWESIYGSETVQEVKP